MIYRLIVLTGEEAGRRITIEKVPMTIGSAPDCSIVVKDEEAARKHASIEHTDDGLIIRDLGSMQKILVNHHEVAEALLKHGDEIDLGRTRFLVQATINAEVDGATIHTPVKRRYVSKGLLTLFCILSIILIAAATGVFWIQHVMALRAHVNPEPEEVLPQTALPQPANGNLATNVAVPAPTQAEATASQQVGTVISPTNEPTLSNELQQVREELAGIREIVQGMAEKQAATSTPQTAAANGSEPVVPPGEQAPVVPAAVPHTNAKVPPKVTVPSPSRPVEPPPAESTPEQQIPAGALTILSVEQTKFPKSDDYDEMRALSITIKLDSDIPVDAGKVALKVTFFDRNVDSGVIAPTRAVTSARPIKIEGEFLTGQQKLLTATYLVPKQQDKPARREQFYGFAVRLCYGEKVLDETARPDDVVKSAGGRLK
jgi:predicted component of type VI protein secretion system